jgi:hypothetical protein
MNAATVEHPALAMIKSGIWLDNHTFPPLSWAVPGVIPEGFGLLTGPPKAGKSWLALGIVLALASGGHALGKVPVGAARPVLLLALEDGDRRLQDRCRRLLDGEHIPGRLDYVTDATPGQVLAVIEAWLTRYGTERPLVVLDTLGKVMPPTLPGESAYQRDYRVGGRLKALVDPHPGAALVVVHHVRKATGEDWMDSTSGTNGLNGSADFTVSLSRPRNETGGVLRVTGRDVPEGEYALDTANGKWSLTGSSLADAAKAAERAKATAGLGERSSEIVALVAEHPTGIGPTEVGMALGLEPKSAGVYLARLADAGRIRKVGRGLYATSVESVVSVECEGTDTNPVKKVVSVQTSLPTITSISTLTTVSTPFLGNTCGRCTEPLAEMDVLAGSVTCTNCEES